MVFEIQQLSKKVPLFRKSMKSTLNCFPKGKFQIHKSRPVFFVSISGHRPCQKQRCQEKIAIFIFEGFERLGTDLNDRRSVNLVEIWDASAK